MDKSLENSTRQYLCKKYLILISLLLCTLFSYSQNENWDVYLAQYEKGVGSTVINMSLKGNAPLKDFPYLLKTGVTLKNCNDDGLPVKAEFETLYKISDSINAAISAFTKNKLSGTFSYQCERTDYYYVTDTIGLRKALAPVYEKYFPAYKYSISLRADKDWEAYLGFLYPNEETMEYMSNSKVVLNLSKEGDDLSKPRQVDHWLYFSTEKDRANFIAYAMAEKFKVEGRKTLKDVKLRYQLQISRSDKVDIAGITAITISLRKKAKEFNGDYDGWETFIVKDK